MGPLTRVFVCCSKRLETGQPSPVFGDTVMHSIGDSKPSGDTSATAYKTTPLLDSRLLRAGRLLHLAPSKQQHYLKPYTAMPTIVGKEVGPIGLGLMGKILCTKRQLGN